MLVSDVVKDLAVGELRNISIKNDKDAIASFIYQALLALYVKYNLKTSEYILTLDGYNTSYELPNDCLRVVAVYDENGNSVPLNDEECILSVFTPSDNIIEIPEPTADMQLSIIYYATPSRITYDSGTDTFTPSSFTLNAGLYQALLNYVAYKAFSSINGETNTENNVYMLRFEASCKEAELRGVFPEDNSTNRKFSNRGFK